MDGHERANDLLMGELSGKIELLVSAVASLQTEVKELTAQAHRGKGFIWGALLMAGGTGAALSEVLSRVMKP